MNLSTLILNVSELGTGVPSAIQHVVGACKDINVRLKNCSTDKKLTALYGETARLKNANPERPQEIIQLAAVFLHTAAILMSPKDEGQEAPYETIKKKVIRLTKLGKSKNVILVLDTFGHDRISKLRPQEYDAFEELIDQIK